MTLKFALPTSIVFAAAVAMTGAAVHAQEHVMVTPDEVEWQDAPASVPEGAEMAVLYGTPSEEGQFTLRLSLPDGYHIPPHSHPRPEIVTILSGTLEVGMGDSADRDETQPLPAGSFFAFEPGMAHYVYADGETVIQLNSIGPWGLEYVDSADDPRGTN